MKGFALSVAAAVAGYLLGAVGGYFLIATLSSNTHDRSVEAAMTSAFLTGPIGALVGFVAGMIYFRDKRQTR